MSESLVIPDGVKEDILLACRYGELEEVQALVKAYGMGLVAEIHDENKNSILHMASANGHTGMEENFYPIPA